MREAAGMRLFSNEIVFRGHPDKVCDQISDTILMECLKQDPKTRAGIEVVGGKGIIFITGELTTEAEINIPEIAIGVLKEVGYPTAYKVINNVGMQSADIALGTDIGGAGDNGMMFGYATNDTKQLLPTAMVILQHLAREYDDLRKSDPRFKPDGKAQITGMYDDERNLIGIKTFTICYNNTEENRTETDYIIMELAKDIAKAYNIGIIEFLINPTGKFLIGGFEGDAGLTGRKIVVDNYHSFGNVGGGAFSGKDPSKVDRSGAYKARQIAERTLIEQDLKWCEVQLSYAIGKKEPLAIYITSDKGDYKVNDVYYKECTPEQIIKDLDLINCNYAEKAAFGHFTDRSIPNE